LPGDIPGVVDHGLIFGFLIFLLERKYIIKQMVIAGTVMVTFPPLVEAVGVDLGVLGFHDGGLVGIVAH
jgi:hypothetical protein